MLLEKGSAKALPIRLFDSFQKNGPPRRPSDLVGWQHFTYLAILPDKTKAMINRYRVEGGLEALEFEGRVKDAQRWGQSPRIGEE
jgi:hypothetical protein